MIDDLSTDWSIGNWLVVSFCEHRFIDRIIESSTLPLLRRAMGCPENSGQLFGFGEQPR